jgi:hypothetical protein
MRQFDTIPQRAAGVFWKPASAHRLNKASAKWGVVPPASALPMRRPGVRRCAGDPSPGMRALSRYHGRRRRRSGVEPPSKYEQIPVARWVEVTE